MNKKCFQGKNDHQDKVRLSKKTINFTNKVQVNENMKMNVHKTLAIFNSILFRQKCHNCFHFFFATADK